MGAVLIIMAGLSGTGKTTLADAVAKTSGAAVFAHDPIESAILDAGIVRSFETGLAAYIVSQRLASDHLALGQTAIGDACDYVEGARQSWRLIAEERGVPMLVVECVCSDAALHRRLVEARDRGLNASVGEPSWDEVQARVAETPPWPGALVVDSVRSLKENVAVVLARVREIAGEEATRS